MILLICSEKDSVTDASNLFEQTDWLRPHRICECGGGIAAYGSGIADVNTETFFKSIIFMKHSKAFLALAAGSGLLSSIIPDIEELNKNQLWMVKPDIIEKLKELKSLIENARIDLKNEGSENGGKSLQDE